MVEENKKSTKDENKMKELKIELLKNASKRKKVKREVAKLLTLQNKMKNDKEQKK